MGQHRNEIVPGTALRPPMLRPTLSLKAPASLAISKEPVNVRVQVSKLRLGKYVPPPQSASICDPKNVDTTQPQLPLLSDKSIILTNTTVTASGYGKENMPMGPTPTTSLPFRGLLDPTLYSSGHTPNIDEALAQPKEHRRRASSQATPAGRAKRAKYLDDSDESWLPRHTRSPPPSLPSDNRRCQTKRARSAPHPTMLSHHGVSSTSRGARDARFLATLHASIVMRLKEEEAARKVHASHIFNLGEEAGCSTSGGAGYDCIGIGRTKDEAMEEVIEQDKVLARKIYEHLVANGHVPTPLNRSTPLPPSDPNQNQIEAPVPTPLNDFVPASSLLRGNKAGASQEFQIPMDFEPSSSPSRLHELSMNTVPSTSTQVYEHLVPPDNLPPSPTFAFSPPTLRSPPRPTSGPISVPERRLLASPPPSEDALGVPEVRSMPQLVAQLLLSHRPRPSRSRTRARAYTLAGSGIGVGVGGSGLGGIARGKGTHVRSPSVDARVMESTHGARLHEAER